MNSFENAEKFFHSCEASAGWDACKTYVANDAQFTAQSEPLVEVKTVKDYVDWMAGFGKITAPGSKYELHTAAYDEANNTAIFFATYQATHSGEGGPVPPTQQTTKSHYVYALKMNDNGKVKSMTKIWNAPWAMRELGWM